MRSRYQPPLCGVECAKLPYHLPAQGRKGHCLCRYHFVHSNYNYEGNLFDGMVQGHLCLAHSSVHQPSCRGTLPYPGIWYVSWYVRTLISPFFCLRYKICFSHVLCVLSPVFYLFSSCLSNFPCQSYCSLSCDHGLHCSHDSIMWEQQQQHHHHEQQYIYIYDTVAVATTSDSW